MARSEREVQAAVKEMERKLLAVDDADLESETEALADEDKDVAGLSTDVDVDGGDVLDQNERAMNNWPIEARQKVAKRLLAIAQMIVE